MNKILNIVFSHKKIIILSLIFVLLLRVLYSIYKFEFKYNLDEDYKKIKVEVISLQKISEDKIVYLVKYNKDRFLLNIYIKDEILEDYKNFKYGEILNVNGKFSSFQKLGNPYEFDYKKYLNSNDICGTISTYKVSKSADTKKNIFYNMIFSYKEKLEEKINASLLSSEAGLFKAMLYSDKIDLEEDLKEDITNNGISHILTVSSTSVFYIITIVHFLRKFFNKYAVKILQIFFSIFLVMISGMQISIIRAEIFILIDLIIPEKNKLSRVNKLIISLYIVLLMNPYNIFNVSAIYSYLAVFSIIFIYNNLKAKIYYIIKFYKLRNKIFLSKVLSYIINSFILTLSIIICAFPVQIITSNSFNFITFLSNLLVLPFVLYIRFIGYISMFLVYFFDISNILISSCFIPLKIIEYITQILSNVKLQVTFATPSFISVVFYYLIIVFYILKENAIKKLVLSKKKLRIRLKFLINIISIIFIIFIIFEQIYIQNFEDYIYFFNVKQGNMCIIRKNGKTVIVDIGSTSENLASNIINNFLQAKNIKKIDLVLLTHLHSDHINGLYKLSEDIKIEKVAIGKIWHTINEEYKKLNEFLDEKSLVLEEVEAGDSIKIGSIKIDCISPNSLNKISSNDEINSNSGVYLIDINKKQNGKILFMGDATKETEKVILEKYSQNIQNISILQVGHHGSKTSTSEEFLKVVNPKISIISSYKKVYSHPSEETIKLFNKYNLKYLITEQDKAIKINI